MLYTRLARQLKFQRIRQFHTTIVKNENKSVSETSTKPQRAKSSMERDIIGAPLHPVGKIDRMILVWVKRFPSMDKVPPQVTIDCIRRAHTMFRIRVSFIIMGLSIVGFIASVMIGKRDVAAGKNLLTERMKWHQEIREKAKSEAAANANKAE